MDEPILISSLDGGTSIIDDYGSGSRVPHPGKSLRAQRWTARSWEDWAVSAKSPCTVRIFDPKSEQWSIYWVDGVHGILTTPMIGGFTQGRGTFYAQEIFEGEHIFSRFLWSGITTTSCHWEQAFSEDGGSTWETNWMMELNRQQE